MPEALSTIEIFTAPPLALALASASILAFLALSVGAVVVRSFERVDRWTAALIFALAAALLFPSAEHAALLRTSPDSVEYALGAERLLALGSYSIPLGGWAFPPRYPLGFPLLVVVPSVLVAGSGVYGVWLCAALSAAAAYLVGARLLSRAAGFMATGLLLALPLHVAASQEVLSTAPAGAFLLLALLCSVSSAEARSARWIGAGLSVMAAAACRPLSVVFLIPALVAWRRDSAKNVRGLLWIVAPSAALAAFMAWYNWTVFGSPLRSGYSFWCPVPYDYPQLLLSMGYLVDNFLALTKSGAAFVFPLALLAIASPALAKDSRRKSLAVERAAAVAAAIATTFHLLYFWPWGAYFEPFAAALAPVAGAGAALVASRVSQRAVPRLTTAVLGLGVIAAWGNAHKPEARSTDGLAQLRQLQSVAQDLASRGSVTVVTARNPALVEALTGARALPASRRVEYASKLVAPRRLRLDSLAGVTPTDHRLPALRAAGALEAFPETATDSAGPVARLLEQGQPVIVDAASLAPEDSQKIRSEWTVDEVAIGVWRLSPRASGQ